MAYLPDTNVLVRLANISDLLHSSVLGAVEKLDRHGEIMHVTSQTLIEFRSVATRPMASNGLGMAAVHVEVEAAAYESVFGLLEEKPDIYPAWKALVMVLGVIGKQVHDAARGRLPRPWRDAFVNLQHIGLRSILSLRSRSRRGRSQIHLSR